MISNEVAERFRSQLHGPTDARDANAVLQRQLAVKIADLVIEKFPDKVADEIAKKLASELSVSIDNKLKAWKKE